ncbi:MAG: hypothetical protein KJZ59_10260, partial [Pararhodobacter sp.]|nr:hypothetical protein [Pararhodobacter sp.]
PKVLRRVRDHECNFGIVETRVFPVGIRTLHVHEGPAMCILPEGHRLSDHEVIEPKDLDGEVFIQMIAAAQLGELTARLLAERKIKCRSIIECRLAYLAQKLVMEGVGISIIDPLTAQLHAEQGGVVRPFLPRLVNSISFIARDDSVLTQIEQRFVDKSVAYLSAMEGAPMRRVRPDRIATDPPGP